MGGRNAARGAGVALGSGRRGREGEAAPAAAPGREAAPGPCSAASSRLSTTTTPPPSTAGVSGCGRAEGGGTGLGAAGGHGRCGLGSALGSFPSEPFRDFMMKAHPEPKYPGWAVRER